MNELIELQLLVTRIAISDHSKAVKSTKIEEAFDALYAKLIKQDQEQAGLEEIENLIPPIINIMKTASHADPLGEQGEPGVDGSTLTITNGDGELLVGPKGTTGPVGDAGIQISK